MGRFARKRLVLTLAALLAGAGLAWAFWSYWHLDGAKAPLDRVILNTDLDTSPVQPLPQTLDLNADQVALGRRLFHDVRLSADDTVSCASCHAIDRFGVDGQPVSRGIQGRKGDVNAPTVFNSGFNFRQFWDGRAATLAETGLPAEALELEITESMLMEEVQSSQATLATLKGLGCMLAIDDFGTGYSSLAYLKRFQLDVLKIDKSFVDGLGSDANDSAMVRAIVSLARSLGLSMVAEGVESGRQFDALARFGGDDLLLQGYLMGRPMPAEELERRLAARAA